MSEPAATWLVAGAVEVRVESDELCAVVAALLGPPAASVLAPRSRVRICRAEPSPSRAAAMATAPDGVHPVRVAGEPSPAWCTNRAWFTASSDVECAIASPQLLAPAASDRHPERFYYRYLAFAVQLAMWRAGALYLHAAVLVGPDGRAVLIAGPSGSGKSTLCIALLEAGWSVLSDDSVYVAADADHLIALPRPMHLDLRLAAAFPRLHTLVGRPPYLDDRRKVAAQADELYPGRVVPRAPFPARIVLPCIRDVAASRAAEADPARARGELDRNALAVLDGEPWFPGTRAAVLDRLIDGADCIELVSGKDAAADPRRLVALVAPGWAG